VTSSLQQGNAIFSLNFSLMEQLILQIIATQTLPDE
jgi:hypothetical protein